MQKNRKTVTFIVILLWTSGWLWTSGFSMSKLFLLCFLFLCLTPVIGSGEYLLCFSLVKYLLLYIHTYIVLLKIRKLFIFELFCHLLLFFPLFWETDSVPSAEATMYSGEPSLMMILFTDCWLYSATWTGSTVDGCGPIGLIVSYKYVHKSVKYILCQIFYIIIFTQ